MTEKKKNMRKSEFVLIKCKGCGKPFKGRAECKPEKRPEECNYCKQCLSFRKMSILQIDSMYHRLQYMEDELDRLKKLHEDRMKQFYDDDL